MGVIHNEQLDNCLEGMLNCIANGDQKTFGELMTQYNEVLGNLSRIEDKTKYESLKTAIVGAILYGESEYLKCVGEHLKETR